MGDKAWSRYHNVHKHTEGRYVGFHVGYSRSPLDPLELFVRLDLFRWFHVWKWWKRRVRP